MHDLKRIRESPEAFDAMLRSRGREPASARVLELDRLRRAAQTAFQELQARRNTLSRRIGAARAAGEDIAELMAESAELASAIAREEAEEKRLADELQALLATLPNWFDEPVPPGASAEDNVVRRAWGEPRRFGWTPLQHFELGERLGLMDFEAAAKLSGARFVVLRGALARLERAIAQFMIDLQTDGHGYTEVSPPLLVREEALFGTGQLPKFREEQFVTTDGRWLIPTAEVPLTNLVRERILAESDLPIRFAALTPCFRAEAGSAGRDVRGMLRQHQFLKVELVSVTTPEQSEAEHERMTRCAETVLQQLGLAYRVVELCSSDLGFSAARTFDLEVWLPGQGAWREISSCSNCRDFQARRMDARYRPTDGKGTRYVHTLNGSGLAVGRTLIAVMETYQRADGGIDIPEALRPYMGGLSAIIPV